MDKDSKIYVAGHSGMVGSAICRALRKNGYNNLVLRTSNELDLRLQVDVNHFFSSEKPDYVFLAAAKVGGIFANNTYRADFLYENLMIESNIIHYSYLNGVKKLMFLGSTCMYPKLAPQPLTEECILTGILEDTIEPYAIAKITGIKLCESYRRQYDCDFISVMSTNLYGYGDNYDLVNSHVLPALMRKFHTAKEENQPFVTAWGSGLPRRELMFADDMADACLHLMNHYSDKKQINVGTGEDLSIQELTELVAKTVGYNGEIRWDESKPDGAPRKLVDVTKLNALGWKYSTTLAEGIKLAYADFVANQKAYTV